MVIYPIGTGGVASQYAQELRARLDWLTAVYPGATVSDVVFDDNGPEPPPLPPSPRWVGTCRITFSDTECFPLKCFVPDSSQLLLNLLMLAHQMMCVQPATTASAATAPSNSTQAAAAATAAAPSSVHCPRCHSWHAGPAHRHSNSRYPSRSDMLACCCVASTYCACLETEHSCTAVLRCAAPLSRLSAPHLLLLCSPGRGRHSGLCAG